MHKSDFIKAVSRVSKGIPTKFRNKARGWNAQLSTPGTPAAKEPILKGLWMRRMPRNQLPKNEP